jgi:hypothetical protein
MSSELAPLALTSPQPLQVIQRSSVAPGLGAGLLRLAGSGAPPGAAGAQVRTVLCAEAYGDPTDWTDADFAVAPDGAFTAALVVSAGGWFRLEVRLVDAAGSPVAAGVVEPVGVGEVFVVAGQSYAAVCHERVLVIEDPMGRVAATTPETPVWRVANDPQPGIKTRIDLSTLAELAEVLAELDLSFPHGEHSPFQGSIWPAFGNSLLTLAGVPVGLVHAAVGATRIGHWQPGLQLFTNVVDAVTLVGDYRALLWQQGESDVANETGTEQYVALLRAFRAGIVEATGLDRPWLLAKSTHHPNAGHDEALELPIRAAVDQLWGEPGFRRGPDTDVLRGADHRAGWFRGSHFTALGQQKAGLMWAAEVHTLLRSVEEAERASKNVRERV